jgi:hypothetical protein
MGKKSEKRGHDEKTKRKFGAMKQRLKDLPHVKTGAFKNVT